MMPNQTIIFLHSTPTLADWTVYSETGEVIQQVTQGQLSELTDSAKAADIIVFVPAQEVLLTSATLPKLNRHQLLKALPFALEEHLIDDVAHLHFAIGEYQSDGTLPVAVVQKEKMLAWLAELKAAAIEPNALMSAIFAIPYSDHEYQVYSHDDLHLVRTGKFSGFSADNDAMLQQMLSVIPAETKISRIDPHSDKDIKKNIVHGINLLQTPYTSKRKATRTKNVWKYSAYLAAAWVGLALISNLISFFILHHQSSRIEASTSKLYKHNFPHATSMNAPRERMEQKIHELNSATQKNNFLSLLAAVGQSFSNTSGVRLQQLDYRNSQLRLEISSASFDNLDILTRDLESHGLTVKQQNSTTLGSQVKASLLINAGAA